MDGSAGHEHFYERIKPQKGIYYFISGGAAKLRGGDVDPSHLTAKAFDTGYHFMLIEIVKDVLSFEVITDRARPWIPVRSPVQRQERRSWPA